MRVARQPSGSGGHLWPLPVRGTITNRFSAGHPAIDIAAPLGTSVRAIAAGTVIDAGWRNNGGGNVVVIRHPDGMVSTYNHNRGVTVRRGQLVEAGQQIAWVGATGLATGPHLDLRIEMGGSLVNPLVVY
jgi:murein DD-endopeptidase MepM/ murein hydrolase activator NlpD